MSSNPTGYTRGGSRGGGDSNYTRGGGGVSSSTGFGSSTRGGGIIAGDYGRSNRGGAYNSGGDLSIIGEGLNRSSGTQGGGSGYIRGSGGGGNGGSRGDNNFGSSRGGRGFGGGQVIRGPVEMPKVPLTPEEECNAEWRQFDTSQSSVSASILADGLPKNKTMREQITQAIKKKSPVIPEVSEEQEFRAQSPVVASPVKFHNVKPVAIEASPVTEVEKEKNSEKPMAKPEPLKIIEKQCKAQEPVIFTSMLQPSPSPSGLSAFPKLIGSKQRKPSTPSKQIQSTSGHVNGGASGVLGFSNDDCASLANISLHISAAFKELADLFKRHSH